MPELPEVETTRRGISPHTRGCRVVSATVRQHQLRWPVAEQVERLLPGQTITDITRRGKYLIFHTSLGHLLIHLGMSGSLRMLQSSLPPGKHDHVDLLLDNGMVLRFSDPRRFGSILWTGMDPFQHPLLASMGPEPLSSDFTGPYLYDRAAGKKLPVKHFIMDGRVVPGVGNIYANEALYLAGIHPMRAAGRISAQRYERLVTVIREVLGKAIAQGGTTLRDFVGGDGKPGYFRQSLAVYGRGGHACLQCNETLTELRSGQRSTVYCRRCQR